ncbi:MAG TPA: hypothetical protein VIE65_21295 [Methylobacter sp.]
MKIASSHGVSEASQSVRILLDRIDAGYSAISAAAAQGLIDNEIERHLRDCILSAYETASNSLILVEKIVDRAVSNLYKLGLNNSSSPDPESKPFRT